MHAERAFVLCRGNVITDANLPAEVSSSVAPSPLAERSEDQPVHEHRTHAVHIPIPPAGLNLDACLHDLEKAAYEEAITSKDGNREAAARLLGIKPHTFRKRAKEKFGL